MDFKSWDAIATLVGAIIGAGVLALPYVVARSGVVPGLAYIVVLGLVMLLLNLMVGEVVLRTKGDHQLAGYAYKYVGVWGGRFMALSLVVGIYGALTAYLIGMGESLVQLFRGAQLHWMLGSFAVLGLLLAQRLAVIERSERYLSAAKIGIIIIVSVIAFSSAQFTTENFTSPRSWTLPFGVVLFSLLGTAAIPEVREELKGNFKRLKGVLVWSSVIPIVVYGVFTLAAVGITGEAASEIATVRLGQFLGQNALILLNVFAMLAMASAFLALGEALKKMFEEDYGWSSPAAWGATLVVPLLVVLLGTRSFVNVIGITGAMAAGLDGIIIVLMYRAALQQGDRQPEYRTNAPMMLQLIVVGVFVLALVWSIAEATRLL